MAGDSNLQRLGHGLGLGERKLLHDLPRGHRGAEGLFIHPTDLDLMGNPCLLQQAATGPRSRSQNQHQHFAIRPNPATAKV